jgi:hypothetical protein
VGDHRGNKRDGEPGVGPFFNPRRDHGKQQCGQARELGPRELDAEVRREAEVGEGCGHLGQPQLRPGGEPHLQRE